MEQENINIPSVSILDIDFLLFAFPLAILLDVVGIISIFISLGVLGFIVSLVLGIPLVVWIVAKETNIEGAKEQIQRLKSLSTAKTKEQQLAARKMLATKMGKKIFTKGLRKLLIGSILVFFPYWTWSVFSVLRKG